MTMLSAVLAQGTTPGAPENLEASTSENSIHLTWSAPMDQGNSTIIAYLIYKGENPGTKEFIGETQSTIYDDFGIEMGKTYYYQVSARNDDGEGSRSNEASAMLTPPSYALSGRVRDSDSGDGIDGARLQFTLQGSQPDQMEAWTDSTGSYNVELKEGNYQVRVQAEGYDTLEDYIYINSMQTKDFEFKGDEGGSSDEFNLSDILGIDEDKVQGYVITAAIIVGSIFSILPLMMIITLIMLIVIFIRLGKVRKELRARNEQDGIFISKKRKRKHDKIENKPTQKKEEKPKPEEKKKNVEVEEEKEEEEEED